MEKNINNFILEYQDPERKEFGLDKIFCSFSAKGKYIINTFEKTENGIVISIAANGKNDNEPELLLLTDNNYQNLKQRIKENLNNIINLKKQHLRNSMMPFKYANFDTDDKLFNKSMAWAILSSSSFVMQKNDEIGIEAGFPWFDNFWSRDTFISLIGVSLVSGRYEEASRIIETFSKYQCLDKKSKNHGKIPNLIVNKNEISYNTSDATPLFIKSCYESFLYSGNFNAILTLWNSIKLALDQCYILKKDKNNFIIQENSDDWMDAQKDGLSYSPRKDIAVEIQALWYVSLYCGAIIAEELIKNEMPLPDSITVSDLKRCVIKYKSEAIKLKESFNKYFVSPEEPYIYDYLSKDYEPNLMVRPNGMLAIYYSTITGIPPLIDRKTGFKLIKFLIPQLIYKHGVSTLSKNDPLFHPVHISEMFHKDAAYHNGVLWNWLSGIFINIASSYRLHNFSFQQTSSISQQILGLDTLGSLNELINPLTDENGNIITSGAYSHVRATSEFCRSFYQDYLGIKLNCPKRKIYFTPAIPTKLGTLKVSIRFGLYETLIIWARVDRITNNVSFLEIKGLKLVKPVKMILKINLGVEKDNQKFKYKYIYMKILFKESNDIFKINFSKLNQNQMKIRELSTAGKCELASIQQTQEIFDEKVDENLQFATPITKEELKKFKTMQEKDYLEKTIK